MNQPLLYLNETLILRRKLEQIVKYRQAVPGTMQASRHWLSSKCMGYQAWEDLKARYKSFSTSELIVMIAQIDNEIELRLDRFYLPTPN